MNNILIIKNEFIIPTKLALTAQEQSKGLMYQDQVDTPLSFLYPYAGINKFWMKNTKIPLDIVFCFKNKIAQICHGKPYSLDLIGDDQLTDLVIEFPYQFCQQNNIQKGDDISLFINKNINI